MQTAQGNIFTRDDTFFGVCEALGEDFGFNAQYLRFALGVMVLVSPTAVVVGYVTAGVAVSRLVAPNPRRAKAPAAEPAALPARPEGDNDLDDRQLAAAA
jgi:phage shock protein C